MLSNEFKERFMAGQADEREIVAAIAGCVKSGDMWQERGYYVRLAKTMIDAGWIDSKGEIL
jgi:hypothetical protein